MFIYPYKKGSKSVAALAGKTGAKRIKLEGSKFKPGPGKVVLNWGSSNMPDAYAQCRVINKPHDVRKASNKLEAFRLMNGIARVPFWSESPEVGLPMVCRTKLTGHSGEGIVIANTLEDVVKAPLYVEYVKKTTEWRIHIFRGEVIFIQKKARRLDVPDDEVNWQVRNHKNGFIYANKDVNPPVDVIEQAGLAIGALGLDFGAVDVIWNEHYEKAYVLEVNTAPGLEGTTLDVYTDAVRKIGEG
jgi:glutathione synthase/RimK-type ligase-like ATP-grasp enzyme